MAERWHALVKIARRRWLLVVSITLAATVVAGVVASTQVKQYAATAKLLLSNSDVVGSTSPQGSSANPDPVRDTNTKVGLIKLGTVGELVRTRLGLHTPVTQLVGKVDATVEGTSNIVDIKATDGDPVRAAAIANAFASEYVAFRQRVAKASLQEAARSLGQQLAALTRAQRRSPQGAALKARLRALKLDSAIQTGGAEVVLKASRPTHPAAPQPLRSAVLGGVIGLLLALLTVALLELTNRRIKDEDEAESGFGVPVLAHIPRRAARAHKAALLNGGWAQHEGYERLATNLVFAGRYQAVSSLMITSPGPQDGKTTVTLGLARALALMGKRVIVIEGDLRRPALAAATDVLADEGTDAASLDDHLVPLDLGTMRRRNGAPNEYEGSVSVLPAGPVPASVSGLLARPEAAATLRAYRSICDFVLIDTPPIGVVNDALALVDVVDAAVVISRLRWTPSAALRGALRTLRGIGVPVLGIVVTGTARVGGYYQPDSGADLNGAGVARPPFAHTTTEGGWVTLIDDGNPAKDD
jgi:tyrosine-protein kinase